jgi:predicted transcriptional regulator
LRAFSNRDRYEIYRDILKVCKKPAIISKITRLANLPITKYCVYKRDVNYLIRKGLLETNSKKYEATIKGHKYIKTFNHMESLLQ